MNRPPNAMTVEMTGKDVKDNLVSIIESMERIRHESIANLGAVDEQKMDYLRMTEELAGCLNPIIKENQLERHADAVIGLVNSDDLLRNYDPLQSDFWNSREPRLRTALNDCSAVMLGDDFVSGSQSYHVFQALKYLNIKNEGERDDVYETILPVNSLLNENSLASPEISSYLLKRLVGRTSSDGAGIRADIDALNFVKALEQTGARYVDVPKELYNQMKKAFPKTRYVEDGKIARVVFEAKKHERGANVFRQLQEYAQLNLGDAEESLVKKMKNFYKFGKEFLSEMKKRIGVREDARKPVYTGSRNIALDEQPADNGNKKTQDNWFDYWSNVNDGRIMASMGDFYTCFKDIKRMQEEGSEEEKAKAVNLLSSIRDDFNRTWEISSTRIFYQPDSLDAKIVQHYKCNQADKVKETGLEIPEYLGVPIVQVAGDSKGLNYLQVLFDTEDDDETIIQTLEFISDKNRKDIKVWAPPLQNDTYSTRSERPERAAGLSCGYVEFHVDGDVSLSNFGRSRGVSENPR